VLEGGGLVNVVLAGGVLPGGVLPGGAAVVLAGGVELLPCLLIPYSPF
jgi:hypothetical protein